MAVSESDYWTWRRPANGGLTKPGIPGFPGLEGTQALLLETIADLRLNEYGSALDLSARGGAVVLSLGAAGLKAGGTDDGAAARLALEHLKISDDGSPAHLVVCTLSGERGNARVAAEIAAAWQRCLPGGTALLAGDKDKGFERYLKSAVALFGAGEVIARARGLRVARLQKIRTDPPAPLPPASFTVRARGRELRCLAYAGTFASGKLDAASALLLEALPDLSGQRVLDIGAGYGALGGFLGLEGAEVTLLEADAPSVRSARETLALNGLSGQVLHSDVDAALPGGVRFEAVVMNPPFHVGRDLKLDVALEFIRAAERRLEPGGAAYLVANHFLPYEAAWSGPQRELVRAAGFKVLRFER